MNQTQSITIMTLCLLLSACQSTAIKQDLQTNCPDLRPQMCTMDFKPVCGVFSEGTTKTFSNACTACSDKNILGFQEGKCPK